MRGTAHFITTILAENTIIVNPIHSVVFFASLRYNPPVCTLLNGQLKTDACSYRYWATLCYPRYDVCIQYWANILLSLYPIKHE